jgi:hypothetical protein
VSLLDWTLAYIEQYGRYTRVFNVSMFHKFGSFEEKSLFSLSLTRRLVLYVTKTLPDFGNWIDYYIFGHGRCADSQRPKMLACIKPSLKLKSLFFRDFLPWPNWTGDFQSSFEVVHLALQLHAIHSWLIHSPHMLVHATSERFLPVGGIFRVILASESHWLQPMLILFIQWWPTPIIVGRALSVHSEG